MQSFNPQVVGGCSRGRIFPGRCHAGGTKLSLGAPGRFLFFCAWFLEQVASPFPRISCKRFPQSGAWQLTGRIIILL